MTLDSPPEDKTIKTFEVLGSRTWVTRAPGRKHGMMLGNIALEGEDADGGWGTTSHAQQGGVGQEGRIR